MLLSHSSGLPAWRPYYKKLCTEPIEKRKKLLLQWILQEPLEYEPESQSLYSDLGFMLLGMLVEKGSAISLDDYVVQNIYKPLKLDEELFFNRVPLMKNRQYAATECCCWRDKILAGEVHDDNAWVTGGVGGHAGLFGTVGGVFRLTELLFDQWQGRVSHPAYFNDDLRECLKRNSKKSTWGLGFDTPNEQGASCGKYFSKRSVGHLGFTGTSFWIDPEKDLVVVLLTNRVHPNRNNTLIRQFRPDFHDRIINILGFI